MALGVPGTGPYGKIRRLQQEINDCNYELSLITQGMRRRLGKKKLEEIIIINRKAIKQIRDEEGVKRK